MHTEQHKADNVVDKNMNSVPFVGSISTESKMVVLDTNKMY